MWFSIYDFPNKKRAKIKIAVNILWLTCGRWRGCTTSKGILKMSKYGTYNITDSETMETFVKKVADAVYLVNECPCKILFYATNKENHEEKEAFLFDTDIEKDKLEMKQLQINHKLKNKTT